MRFLFRLIGALALLAGACAALAADCPRIVSQSPYLTIALQWLERGECIVGVSRYDHFRPELPRTGGLLDPDADALARLEPAVVFTSDWVDRDLMALSSPPGAQLHFMGGFNAMADTEAMLLTLARASGSPRLDLAKGFPARWRALARRSGARGERVLLLTACSGTPYSYGRRHMLGDLFQAAGFNVVEADTRVRAVRPGEAHPDLAALVAHHRPDIVFTFDRATDDTCRVILGDTKQRIVHLNGDDFLNPGPRLLDALKALSGVMQEQQP
jgi:iron complex transport system substrate-binding protein